MGQGKKDKVNCKLQEKQKARREREGHPCSQAVTAFM